MEAVLQRLLASEEPSVRYKANVGVLGKSRRSRVVRDTEEEITKSSRVQGLLSERGEDGKIPYGPYSKWYGSHWVLATLADLGYPPGDESLHGMRDQVYDWLLSKRHVKSVQIVADRARRCGSQESNALWAMMKLGIDDERADVLVEHLLKWQWPDGGWNCDRRAAAQSSSLHETWIGVRALHLYGTRRKSPKALDGAARAAEVLLCRNVYKRRRDGAVIDRSYTQLRYPHYWRYSILAGLTVLAEAGLIGDERCTDALDWLEAQRLDDGGFPAQDRFYRATRKTTATGSSASRVDWGGQSKRRMNEWVTAEALTVLNAAGRMG